MFKRTALALLISLPAAAQQLQEVKPILSDAYKRSLQKKTDAGYPVVDSSISSLQLSSLTMGDNYSYYYHNGGIQKIIIRDNKIKLIPLKPRELMVTGTYTGSITAVSANRQPALQHEYAQGRSINGALTWQGAETNEFFSYGPMLSQLEYDGQAYPFDINGRLVQKGTDKQIPAHVYNNSILQNAIEWKQRLVTIAEFKEYGLQKYYAKITVAKSNEQLVIKNNQNEGYNIGFSAGATVLNNLKLIAGIEIQQQDFTNGNRNGFLNRVYMQSLLTPVSFSNQQGYVFNNGQRSFSNINDNPLFLLSSANPYRNENKQMHFSAEYRFKKFSFKSLYTPSRVSLHQKEHFMPGTAFFPSGISNNRQQKNSNKTLSNTFSYNSAWNDHWQHNVTAMLSNSWVDVSVTYRLQPAYNWKRNTTDASLLYNANWRHDHHFEGGFSVGNNVYTSTTATKKYAWLPTAGVYARWNRIGNSGSLRLFANTKKIVHEPSIINSYAGIASLAFTTAEAMRFFPVKEVNSFNGLAAERHTQYNAGVEFYISYSLGINATAFINNVRDAIFPTLSPTGMELKNMANYRSSGIEIQLTNRVRLGYQYSNLFSNTLSFFLSRNKVTHINSGFENMPLSGFMNVHKALVKDLPVGSIMGSDYRYDDKGKKIIGADGFPLTGKQLKVIGNPVPDFTIKWTPSLVYRRWSFVADWEWRKGGDMWNGTRAVLDYYGRSAASASQRNTKQYVFDGVNENGTPNNVAVDFYSPALPIEQNRWVRYGYAGVAKEYIEDGSFIKLNNVSVSYNIPVKKWLRKIELTAAAGNLLIWAAYKGVDPSQLFFDQPAAEGLDFFNLPSLKRYSFILTLQF